ncbi:MAG: hypothetical protein MUF49_12180 [Oculatellaceae cyanobacterium Prado106]|nr:hypothetical protein [Oculatellaceae cyanobacterium Prado106]
MSAQPSKNLPVLVFLVLGAIVSLFATLLGSSSKTVSPPQIVTPSLTPTVTSGQTAPLTAKPKLSPTPGARVPYKRPTTADNGSPFPATSGYIKGYPQEFTDGYSSLTIDNSKSDADAFIKLRSKDTQNSKVVSVFLVKAKESFTVEQIRAGSYDILYRDLDTGRLSRSESFNLQENSTAEGVQFSRMTLTLYKVSNGNMQMYPVSEEEFQ